MRSAMRAASQLPGRGRVLARNFNTCVRDSLLGTIRRPRMKKGGPLLWIWPLYLHVNQKSDDDDELFSKKTSRYCHSPGVVVGVRRRAKISRLLLKIFT